jgi:DNA/RNA endonuclease YhcR with UshA esterase domain
MEEKTLIKIAITVSLVGLVFLFLYSDELSTLSINNLDDSPKGETVKLSGVVKRVSSHEKIIFIEVSGQRTEQMDVIVFNDEELFLKEGDFVEVTGEVEEYKEKKEVIASKVVLK